MRFSKELVSIPSNADLKTTTKGGVRACVFRVLQDKYVFFCVCYYPLSESFLKEINKGDQIYIWGNIEMFHVDGNHNYRWIIDEFKKAN